MGLSRLKTRPTASEGSRPKHVTDLFYGGDTYEDWQAFNWKRRRFFLLNGRRVLGLLRVTHTKTDRYFQQAEELILTETDWPAEFAADYATSKTQIYPQRLDEAKLLAKALTITVALECIARSENSKINVYDYLRIVPAWYFVDGLDSDRYRDLSRAFDQLPSDQKQWRAANTGGRPGADFDEACQQFCGQPASGGLLRQTARGFCVTRDVADGIVRFIDLAFGGNQGGIGPVQTAGTPGSYPALGTKDAAPALRPPIDFDQVIPD